MGLWGKEELPKQKDQEKKIKSDCGKGLKKHIQAEWVAPKSKRSEKDPSGPREGEDF